MTFKGSFQPNLFYDAMRVLWQASMITLRRQGTCSLGEPVFIDIKEEHTN